MLTESAEFHPVTPYGSSKVLVERDVAELAMTLQPIFLRTPRLRGVSRMRFDLVLNNLVAWPSRPAGLPQERWNPWRRSSISRTSHGIPGGAGSPRELVHNQAFNVGANEENYRIRALASWCGDRTRLPPGVRSGRRAGQAQLPRRLRKIERTLPRFKPKWNARRGAQELYAAYQKFGLSLEEFEGPGTSASTTSSAPEHGRLDASLR